jgi:hypothetical protein
MKVREIGRKNRESEIISAANWKTGHLHRKNFYIPGPN